MNNNDIFNLEKFYKLFIEKYDITKFKKVAIIGSGFSLKKINLNKLIDKDTFVIAINWALDYLKSRKININLHFTIDRQFYKKLRQKKKLNILKDNKEIIFIFYPNKKKYDINTIYNQIEDISKNIKIIIDDTGYNIKKLKEFNHRVPSNSISGNKAIFLALNLGFKKIDLYGFDSINPNIENPDIYDKKKIHCDPHHCDKKKYNDILLKLSKNYDNQENNIYNFFKLLKKQKENKKDKIIIKFI